MAHSERQKEHRQELRKSNETKIKCASGEGIDLPRHGDPLDLVGLEDRTRAIQKNRGPSVAEETTWFLHPEV
jgi:hypothetical protein